MRQHGRKSAAALVVDDAPAGIGDYYPWERPSEPQTPAERAKQNILWCRRYIRIPEGRGVGDKLKMAPFMKDDLTAIYGNPAGTRRAIVTRGRKNAKTMLGAMLMLLHLVGYEHKRNSQLYSAAQSRDQAALTFNLMAKMVRLCPQLHPFVQIRETRKELLCPRLGTIYRALSAEAPTAYGLNPAMVLFDELGQVKGPRSALYDALETAVGAQPEPLSIVISTQARTDSDLLSILIDDASAGHDPRVVLRLNTAPPELDPFEEATIALANPALEIFMNKTEVLAMASDARRMPAREAEYRNLILNQRVETSDPFVSQGVWKAGARPVADLHGRPVYGGLDLSSVADLTALVLTARIGSEVHVKPTFWLPGDGIALKSQQDRVPYDQWAKAGQLELCPGKAISYEYVARHLFQLFAEYDIRKIAFDRWNFKHLRPWLREAGFSEYVLEERFVEFGQGTQSMSPALRDLEQILISGELVHGGHPVLTMNAACAVVEGKDDANRKLSKNKSSGRIDGLVALTMAVGVMPMRTMVDISALIG